VVAGSAHLAAAVDLAVAVSVDVVAADADFHVFSA
jgi:hypothetical protein